jgi:hypothetical protein
MCWINSWNHTSKLRVSKHLLFYYESTKRELKRRPMYEYGCDERLQTKSVGSTRLVYTVVVSRLFAAE